MKEAPRPRWKAPLLVLLSFLLCAGGTALWIDAGANAKWERMRARVAELRRQVDDRVRNRPSLADDPIEGNAWEDYEAALAAYRPVRQAWRSRAIREHNPELPSPTLQAHPEIRDALTRGVRRKALIGPTTGPSVWDLKAISMFAIEEAAPLIALGRLGDGIDCAFLGLLLARDYMLLAELSPIDIEPLYKRAIDRMRSAVQKGLTPTELSSLDRRLAILESHRPSFELFHLRWLCSYGEDYLKWVPRIPPSYRLRTHHHLWNARISAVTLFERQERWVQTLTAFEELPWREAKPRLDESVAAESKTGAFWVDGDVSAVQARVIQSSLRVLRTAVKYLRVGELQGMPDLLGDSLRVSHADGKTRIWSVGPDGIDDNGAGDDLVLELAR